MRRPSEVTIIGKLSPYNWIMNKAHKNLGFDVFNWVLFHLQNRAGESHHVIHNLRYLNTNKAQRSAISLFKVILYKNNMHNLLKWFATFLRIKIHHQVTYRKLCNVFRLQIWQSSYLFIYEILISGFTAMRQCWKRWIFHVLYHIYQYTCINVLWIK